MRCNALHCAQCNTLRYNETLQHLSGTGKTDLRAPALTGFTFKRFSLSFWRRAVTHQRKAPVSLDDFTALRRRTPQRD